MEITRQQYEFALARIEELLPIVDDQTAVTDRNAVELVLLSDIVIEYESIHFPIEKPTIAELMELALEERKMTQRELAREIGVSPSRINDFMTGRAEPSLKIAKRICLTLGITASAMLGL
ncbi:MAG: helix-turn-helix transcriptional regulator [Bacteroidales bacterium]|nr:helix-turn-helix transcriptional regulator [Bacteroidales bacterium]